MHRSKLMRSRQNGHAHFQEKHLAKWQVQIQTGYDLLREIGCAEIGCFKIGMGRRMCPVRSLCVRWCCVLKGYFQALLYAFEVIELARCKTQSNQVTFDFYDGKLLQDCFKIVLFDVS